MMIVHILTENYFIGNKNRILKVMIINPYTKRKIKLGGKTHQELIENGLLDDKGKEIKKCKWDITDKIVGSGSFGNIHLTCCNNENRNIKRIIK